MLRWCAYCQQFQGEIPPFADFRMTHSICACCKAKGAARLDAEIEHSRLLKQAQSELMVVGLTGDVDAAERIIDEISALGIRYVDVLVGLIAPLLYTIGQEWEEGTMTVTQEHRFTYFCERVFQLVSVKMRSSDLADTVLTGPPLLLLNAYGNRHTIGIRILGLWLRSQNFHVMTLIPSPEPKILTELVETLKPQAVLISASLAKERSAILKMILSVTSGKVLPAVIIGGHAIKMGLMDPIPGTSFLANGGDLPALLQHVLDEPR